MKTQVVVLTARPYSIEADPSKNQRANEGISLYYYIPGSNVDKDRIGDDIVKASVPMTCLAALKSVPLPGAFDATLSIGMKAGQPVMKITDLHPVKA